MKRIFSISILMFCLPFFLFAQSTSSGNGRQRANGYEYVDLGLSVKWATCNVGATSPEEYGGHYQWAGKQNITNNNLYDFDSCPYHIEIQERYITWEYTKYVTSNYSSTWSGAGSPDNKTVLDPSDDVAHVMLGGKWRMPTREEWRELIDNCTWTWSVQNGVRGYKVTGKKPGYTDKSIFLPAAGYIDEEDGLLLSGSNGFYWSSSLDTRGADRAYALFFNSDDVRTTYYGRSHVNSVRPVLEY